MYAVLAAGIVAGAAVAILTQPGAPFGPPARPLYAGDITVVFIDAEVTVEQSNESVASLQVDPGELPHCANAYLWDDGLHVFTGRWGRAYDPLLRAMILFSYWDRGGFISMYENSVAYDLGAAGVTIFAALNHSTAIYTIRFGGKVEVIPQAAPRSIDGDLSIGYTVNGTFFGGPDGWRAGPFDVVEIHTISIKADVPVFLHEAGPCI